MKKKLDKTNYEKIITIQNSDLHRFLAETITLCNPKKIFIRSDKDEDIQYVRDEALTNKEESRLSIKGHTVHFDGYEDQARDKEHTRFLVSSDADLGPLIHTIERDKGLAEVKGFLSDSMKKHTMYVGFFVLGPEGSDYSIPAVQITDSAYVMHSEDLLYRNGYESFKKLGETRRYFRFIHSIAQLDYIKRRVYIDAENKVTYSTNTEYGGNTIGLKKPALRHGENFQPRRVSTLPRFIWKAARLKRLIHG